MDEAERIAREAHAVTAPIRPEHREADSARRAGTGGDDVKEHWKCPDCGPHVGVDEDGCCRSCGSDCVAEACDCVAAARLAGARAMQEAAEPWAKFGATIFERFWSDGEPGDIEGGDAQEIARECGLLGRTAEVDAGATHADGCEWQPGMPMDECDCFCPMLKPYSALSPEDVAKEADRG